MVPHVMLRLPITSVIELVSLILAILCLSQRPPQTESHVCPAQSQEVSTRATKRPHCMHQNARARWAIACRSQLPYAG